MDISHAKLLLMLERIALIERKRQKMKKMTVFTKLLFVTLLAGQARDALCMKFLNSFFGQTKNNTYTEKPIFTKEERLLFCDDQKNPTEFDPKKGMVPWWEKPKGIIFSNWYYGYEKKVINNFLKEMVASLPLDTLRLAFSGKIEKINNSSSKSIQNFFAMKEIIETVVKKTAEMKGSLLKARIEEPIDWRPCSRWNLHFETEYFQKSFFERLKKELANSCCRPEYFSLEEIACMKHMCKNNGKFPAAPKKLGEKLKEKLKTKMKKESIEAEANRLHKIGFEKKEISREKMIDCIIKCIKS